MPVISCLKTNLVIDQFWPCGNSQTKFTESGQNWRKNVISSIRHNSLSYQIKAAVSAHAKLLSKMNSWPLSLLWGSRSTRSMNSVDLFRGVDRLQALIRKAPLQHWHSYIFISLIPIHQIPVSIPTVSRGILIAEPSHAPRNLACVAGRLPH